MLNTQPTGNAPRAVSRSHSCTLKRGALGDGVDGRSKEGRFIRDAESELLAHVSAGEPTFTQRLLVRRVSKMIFLAEKLDAKLTGDGNWTPHDARTFGALNNAITKALVIRRAF